MSPALVTAIVQAAVELAYAGIEVSALIEEAKANDGKLSAETLQKIEREVADANDLWTNS